MLQENFGRNEEAFRDNLHEQVDLLSNFHEDAAKYRKQPAKINEIYVELREKIADLEKEADYMKMKIVADNL